MRLPAIFGCSGLVLTSSEREFFRCVSPAGFILFGRNVANRQQLRHLTDTLRDVAGWNVPILIDQEGGRVARLHAPEWPAFPPARALAACYHASPEQARDAVRLNYEALGLMLREVGITVNCAPVLDVPQPRAHDVIGDRAFGEGNPAIVADLGQACLDGLHAAGVVGVIKHIPGHGRAQADSHEALPVVTASAEDLDIDLAPFRALNKAPMAMTAHVRYTAWDAEHCATLSNTIIQRIIREDIGFDGLLMSDDLDMRALEGSIPSLALQAIAAGCDVVLNCWAKMDDMRGIADQLPALTAQSQARLERAMVGAQWDDSPACRKRYTDCLRERDSLLQGTPL